MSLSDACLIDGFLYGITDGVGISCFEICQLFQSNDIIKPIVNFKFETLQQSTFLTYSKSLQKFIFFSSLESLSIIPSLHVNTIKLLGMAPLDEYLASSKIDGKSVAVRNLPQSDGTIKTVLESWDGTTGLFLKRILAKD